MAKAKEELVGCIRELLVNLPTELESVLVIRWVILRYGGKVAVERSNESLEREKRR